MRGMGEGYADNLRAAAELAAFNATDPATVADTLQRYGTGGTITTRAADATFVEDFGERGEIIEHWSEGPSVTIGGTKWVQGGISFSEVASRFGNIVLSMGVKPEHFLHTAEQGNLIRMDVQGPLSAAIAQEQNNSGSFSDWLNNALVKAPLIIGKAVAGLALGGAFPGLDVASGATLSAGQTGLWSLLTSQAPAPVFDAVLNPVAQNLELGGNAIDMAGANVIVSPLPDLGTVTSVPLDPWIPGTPAWPTFPDELAGDFPAVDVPTDSLPQVPGFPSTTTPAPIVTTPALTLPAGASLAAQVAAALAAAGKVIAGLATIGAGVAGLTAGGHEAGVAGTTPASSSTSSSGLVLAGLAAAAFYLTKAA